MSGDPAEQNYTASLQDELSISDTLQAKATTYPQMLLTTARKLIDAGEYGIAVVVAHMASEIATERVLSATFSAKGIQYLEESVMEFLNGYNLANNRIRNLYVSLTGKEVHKARFWPKFKESAERPKRHYSQRQDCGQSRGRGVV